MILCDLCSLYHHCRPSLSSQLSSTTSGTSQVFELMCYPQHAPNCRTVDNCALRNPKTRLIIGPSRPWQHCDERFALRLKGVIVSSDEYIWRLDGAHWWTLDPTEQSNQIDDLHPKCHHLSLAWVDFKSKHCKTEVSDVTCEIHDVETWSDSHESLHVGVWTHPHPPTRLINAAHR